MFSKPGFVLLLMYMLSSLSAPVFAQRATEYEVKAAFLYNFAKFTDWSPEVFENAEAPIVIGVLGADPFGGALDRTIRDKTVEGRRLIVRRFRKVEAGLKSCHILFISSSEIKVEAIFAYLKGAQTLVVGETAGFCQAGGAINFVLKKKRVRFEINVEAVARAGLKMSSRLLKLATIVGEVKSQEGN